MGSCRSRSIAQQAASTRPLTQAQWRADLKHFARELPKRHKNVFHTVSREEFQRAVADLDASIPSLHDHQIVVGMMRIAAKVGDGHTGVTYPRRSPCIRSACTGSGVSSASLAPRRIKSAIGTRVVKIGNVDIDEVHARVRTCFPSAENENEWYVMATSPAFITRPEVLHALGIVADRGPAPFTVVDDQGDQSTLTISPVAFPGPINGIVRLPALLSVS